MPRLLILLLVPLLGGCSFLKINTTPPGADIAINDVYVGKSPVEAKIWFWQTYSPMQITAVKDGYKPGEAKLGFWEVCLWIWGTTKERKIELAALPGTQEEKGTKEQENKRTME